MVITHIKWGNSNLKWNQASGDQAYEDYTGHSKYTWGEIFLISQAAAAIAGGHKDPLKHWDKDKKKNLIKLIFKYKGIVYEDTKEVKKFKITVEDVQLLIADVNSSITIRSINID